MNNYIIVFISLFLALFLSMITFSLGKFSPDWLYLVAIYWILAVPNSIGLVQSWFIGLIADVAFGTVLGLNSLNFVIVTFLVIKSYKFIRYLTVYQQSLIILILLLLKQTILLWVSVLLNTDDHISTSYYWSPFTSALVWPLIFYVLRSIRRKYNVT